MEGGVKFIFKTLIKIPCIIVVCYFFFNLFSFSLTYFKMMGASYAIMQVSMENNYLPDAELKSLNNYVQQFNSEKRRSQDDEYVANGKEMVTDIKIIVETDDGTDVTLAGYNESNGTNEVTNDTNVNKRRQYGKQIAYGLSYTYNWIWPLSFGMFQTNGQTGVAGYGDIKGTTNVRSRAQYIQSQHNNDLEQRGTIKFIHRVPGLQYYSDLD